MIKKITTGFVIQTYGEDGICTGQEFQAGDQVEYEDEDGEPCEAPDHEYYQPLDMVQPDVEARRAEIASLKDRVDAVKEGASNGE